MLSVALSIVLFTVDSVRIETGLSSDSLEVENRTKGGVCEGTEYYEPKPNTYFESGRAELEGTVPDKYLSNCNQQDLCTLMRQMDFDFASRAQKGKMEYEPHDDDKDHPETRYKPTVSFDNNIGDQRFSMKWGMQYGDVCADLNSAYIANPSSSSGKGYYVKVLDDKTRCKKELGLGALKEIDDTRLPPGCFKQGTNPYFNKHTDDCDYTTQDSAAKKCYKIPKDQQKALGHHVKQVCEMDRTLSLPAAVYYSPYKMKTDGKGKLAIAKYAHSTSCSFGQASWMSQKDKAKKSACARILHKGGLSNANPKLVLGRCILMKLMQSNDGWCVNIWHSNWGAKTCEVPREQIGEIDEKKASTIGVQDRNVKYALTQAACDGMPGTSIKDLIDKGAVPENCK